MVEPKRAKSEDGNTVPASSSSKKKQGIQCYRWCFTFNNYEPSEVLQFKLTLDRLCKQYVFQEECGSEGTRHLQGCFTLKKKMRLTELKKIDKRIHWEETRNEGAAEKYCCKEETRIGQIYRKEKKKLFKRTYDKFEGLEPRQEIMDIVTQEPDRRTINWIWSEQGGLGKTSTAAYIERNFDGVCVANGKAADIKMTVINHLEENDLECLIVNVPRQSEQYVNYGVLEEIKDGLIYSGKYEGGFANIQHPHVVVLANFAPDTGMMSEDRWNIVCLDHARADSVC